MVLIIILIVIFKILRKKKQAASEDSSSTKGDYQKLESGELESAAGLEGDKKNVIFGKDSKKKKKKAGKTKGKRKSSRKGSEDLESLNMPGSDMSSVLTNDLAIPLTSKLQFSVSYTPSSRQILLTIHRGENFGLSSTTSFEVRVTLLPFKRQKLKTKSQQSGNPVFNELLVFDEVLPEELESGTLRARVYRLNGRQRKLNGELRADLKADLGLDTSDVHLIWQELTPATDITVT